MASPKKKSLDLLLAIGKEGPKSRNAEGVVGESITEPDQGGGEMMEEEMAAPEPAMSMNEENCIKVPPGFKPPDGVEEGVDFPTTVTGHMMGDKFYPSSIGDMPLNGEAAEPMEEEASETAEEEMAEPENAYAKKKADEKMANSVFQPTR